MCQRSSYGNHIQSPLSSLSNCGQKKKPEKQNHELIDFSMQSLSSICWLTYVEKMLDIIYILQILDFRETNIYTPCLPPWVQLLWHLCPFQLCKVLKHCRMHNGQGIDSFYQFAYSAYSAYSAYFAYSTYFGLSRKSEYWASLAERVPNLRHPIKLRLFNWICTA